MTNKRVVISKKQLVYFLCAYLATIFIWDYTIVYKIALVAMVAVTVLLYKTKFMIKRPYLACSLLLLLYFSVHTLCGLSVNNGVSKTFLVTLSLNLVAALGCELALTDSDDIRRLMKFWIFLAVIMAAYVCIADRSNIFSGDLGAGVTKPITGGEYSHNDIAIVAALAILFLNYFCIRNGRTLRNYILQFFLLAFIILTGARKSLLLALIGMVLYPLFIANGKEHASNKLLKLILALAVLYFAFYAILNNAVLYQLIGHRFSGLLTGITEGVFTESSANTRSVMRKTAIALIKQKPWLGWGLNTFQTFPGSYGAWCHVNYYELWVSGGIVSVVIYYSFYLHCIHGLLKMGNNELRNLFLTVMLCCIVIDVLSVSYVSRFMGVIYVMTDSFICRSKKEMCSNQSYLERESHE